MANEITPDVIANSPYSEWLEELVSTVYAYEPTAICVCMIGEDDSTLCDYYKAGWMDRIMSAGAIQTDAFMLAVKTNGDIIQDAWCENDEDSEDELDEELEEDDEGGDIAVG